VQYLTPKLFESLGSLPWLLPRLAKTCVDVSGLRARAEQSESQAHRCTHFINKQVEDVMCYLRCLNEAFDDSSFAI
jgi:hypothetical protein